jgi:RNase P subunit RPR2
MNLKCQKCGRPLKIDGDNYRWHERTKGWVVECHECHFLYPTMDVKEKHPDSCVVMKRFKVLIDHGFKD